MRTEAQKAKRREYEIRGMTRTEKQQAADERGRMIRQIKKNERHHRRAGELDLANAAAEFLFALQNRYPCPSYRGLGDAGEP